MTTRSALALLHQHFCALREVLRGLVLALDDAPGDEPAVADAMRSAASEVESELASALACDGSESAIALHCQEHLHQMQIYTREFASHANLVELARIAAERGGAWRRWCEVVREAVEACEAALQQTAEAMLGLWREVIAEG